VTLPFRVADVVRWSGGRLRQGEPEAELCGVSIDTRTLGAGQLFVAIRGPSHDAHGFLDAALARGAAGLLLERGRALPAGRGAALPVVEADDTTLALGALAAGHRAGFDGPVVAITGSNGKTTTKEMCAAILSVSRPCLRTRGNLNNQFGLPLTLLERDAEHRAVVVEIGMNHRGEIAPLAAIARPSVAVVTNVGTAHLEHLGSREEIAREKGDLLAGLDPGGVAVVPSDDPLALAQGRRAPGRVVTFGRSAHADVRAEGVAALGERGFAFELVAPEGRAPVHVAGLGEHTVLNALAAAAAALAAGARLDDVPAGLGSFRPVSGRMERLALPRNVILINDTYNANPQSVEVALRSLAELRGRSRAIAVLGDMAELGATAARAHQAVGRLVAALGIDWLFALGPHAPELAKGALEAGMDPARVHVGHDHDETGAGVERILQGDDWVLVKGSRSMHMERVVESLSARLGA
jgi:UDP-N-acetylmuramoyl-tripeptide--D-alanyl-D-alanine ligase